MTEGGPEYGSGPVRSRFLRLFVRLAMVASVAVLAACGGDSAVDEVVAPEETPVGDTTSDDESDSDEVTSDAQDADGVDPESDAAEEEVLGGDSDPVTDGFDSSTMTDAELKAYIAERYYGFWDAFDEARTAPTASPLTDAPQLIEFAYGDYLDETANELTELHSAGNAIREPEAPAVDGTDAASEQRVRVELRDGGQALIFACIVNDNERIDTESGDVISANVLTVEAEATMALVDGDWKIIRSQATNIEPGGDGACWNADSSEYPY